MAILKCKMCGGDVQFIKQQAHGTCESCGTVSTIPTIDDEQLVNLFNRANHFRRENEFDRAVKAYESILEKDALLAEAYWGLVLSRYGIEYVEDPKTHELVPTCHRVQSSSILKDSDYLLALENGKDEYTKSLYEEEAKRIYEIQRDILALSHQEEPYDVFICYKETDDYGSRTKDSILAQEIYYKLTDEGFRVFFSRITLEEKLGTQYEPYIFSALNSSKVMVVVGTKPDYLNAVWLRNEWSRFLDLMKKDKSKLLIPCYSEMNPYDLPEELSVLQSQDMSKIGFLQDLIRGIRKVLAKSNTAMEKTQDTHSATVSVPGVEQLLDRVDLFLEDADFDMANQYCDRILDLDPRNAKAYFKKLMAKLKIKEEADIIKEAKPLTEYGDFKKAVRFADNEFRLVIESYNEQILNDQIYKEIPYHDALHSMKLNTYEGYDRAKAILIGIDGYKDSAELILQCERKILFQKEEFYQAVLRNMELDDYNGYQRAKEKLVILDNYKDCIELLKQCELGIKRKLKEEKQYLLDKEKVEEKWQYEKKVFFLAFLVVVFSVVALNWI